MAKEKRKGLMSLLSEYQTEQGYGEKTKKTEGKGPVKSGKEYGKTLKKNKKEDASGPKVTAPKKPPTKKPQPKTTSRPTPKTPTPKTPTNKTTGKSTTRTLYEGGNVGTGRDGRFGTGTFGRGRPTEGREVEKRNRRGRVVGTERRLPKKEERTMTAAERRRMRLRARRGR